MKALFLIFHGFNPANGISKKIQYQVDALQACGVDTRLCYMREPAGRKLRMIDSEILRDYGTGIKGKILKRIEYSSIVNTSGKKVSTSSICAQTITRTLSRSTWYGRCVKTT